MKKNNYYYEDEKIKLFPFIMVCIGIVIMILFTVLKIKDPNNWSPNGYLFAMGFMFFWTWIAFGFAYYMTLKPRFLFVKEKNDILNNGNIINGEIVDNKKEVKVYTNGQPSAWRYYAKIKLNDGSTEKTFWTPALLFNPQNLMSNNVMVYTYNDKYYTTGFQISNNPIDIKTDTEKIESKKHEYDSDISASTYMCISSIIGGLIFTGFTGWIFIQAADMFTRIVIIPFVICGIGVMLRGLLPLIFNKKKNKFNNIGIKVYLFGFSLFWFGFLIFFDYNAIKQGSIGLLLFSLIFWIAGLFVIIRQLKQLK